MPADGMKLVASGKVLQDDLKTLKDYAIKEGDFLVVMTKRTISAAKRIDDPYQTTSLP